MYLCHTWGNIYFRHTVCIVLMSILNSATATLVLSSVSMTSCPVGAAGVAIEVVAGATIGVVAGVVIGVREFGSGSF